MKIAIIGDGGHSKVIQDIIRSKEDLQIVGLLDDKNKDVVIREGIIFGPILYAHDLINHFDDIRFIIAIGNNKIRKLIVEQLCIPKEYFVTLIHKSAMVSSSSTLGNGTVVMANAVINAGAQIGNHSIINTCSVVEHDNKLGDFVHISPNATLTGSITIQEGVHVGAGAVIIPDIKIEEWTIIGAGATVINNIPSNCTAVGVPAKIKEKSRGVIIC